jgi:hypothetical protein
MMLEDRTAFERKARDWAKRYAGAGGREETEEERRVRLLDGYSEMVVREFTGMGFEVVQVVGALRSVGVGREARILGEQQAARVVERLVGGL